VAHIALLTITSIVAWVYLPTIWLTLAILNGSIWLVVQSLHIVAAVKRPEHGFAYAAVVVPAGATIAEPFVSVHVAIHEEPAELVIATLAALDRIEYHNLEIIVLDNNTKSRGTWAPVEAWCKLSHNKRFIFRHFEDVRDAKAGALNLCLGLMDSRTKYIAVIDADYVVTPDFLVIATHALEYRNVFFVQFPQSYRGVVPAGDAVATELDDYFNAFARRANETRSVMLTGTLSVISATALRACGGWSGRTVTEDAELGVRLFASGHHGLFLDAIVGQGLLPLTYDGLRLQRHRWVTGNVQTLVSTSRHFGQIVRRKGIWSVLTQLTAWPGFWAVPVAVIVLGALFDSTTTGNTVAATTAIEIGALTIIASLVFSFIRLALTCSARGRPFRTLMPTLIVKWSLMWPSSFAWLEVLLARSIPFKRTPKFNSDGDAVRFPNLALASICTLVGVIYTMHLDAVPAIACALVAASLPCAIWVDADLKRYARRIDQTRGKN
jgi:cellulose synthase/poly-beta-1,6-N-acetylglucosamine synthase-like glycosyltransferase